MRAAPWAALGLAVAGGVASAVQGAVNGALGQRLASPVLASTVNTASAALLVLLAVPLMPGMRAGARRLRGSALPWWAYLGGLGGAFLVTAAAYAVPVIGVAAFSIAQVAGNSVGGLVVDRSGLAPLGRISLSWPRLTGAGLGVCAVALAQVGRPVGDLAAGLLALAAAGGVAVALQTALGGRISAVGGTSAGTLVNYAVNAPAMLLVAAGVVAAAGWPQRWPGDWYLYLGGPLGILIVTALVVGARAVGVLRTGLAVVGGQLGGALLLDALIPGGPDASLPVLAAALLTIGAVVIAGRRRA